MGASGTTSKETDKKDALDYLLTASQHSGQQQQQLTERHGQFASHHFLYW